ncbi:MAG TPA: zinc ribbon domain-containing protein [Clostridiales bacterium]|nr:zinc ribbon domain-containing protein [Clostridiales bacterium]
MICPSCGTKNNYYHKFCYNCGASLTADVQETKRDSLFVTEQDINNVQPETDIFAFEPYDDLLVKEQTDKEPEFSIQSQLPLRRYRKEEKSGDRLQKFIKACISIILIALIGFLCYMGYDQLLRNPTDNQPALKRIDLEYFVEETLLDGESARKVTILSDIGEQVRLLDKKFAVVNGQAEIIIPDKEFSLNDYEKMNGSLQVNLPVTILADGYPERNEEIRFEVPVKSAALEVISPSDKEAVVDGDTYKLMLKVEPGSEVFINNNNYTHLLDQQGQLSLQLKLPDQAETKYEIRVSAKGYEDTIDTVILKKRQMEFPLTVDQSVPIQATEGEWVKITGNTHPEAVLSTNLQVREEPSQDPDTGDFKLYVKATAKGYTPFVLTASLEGKEDSVLDLVIERPVSEREYTTSAWAPEYNELKEYPHLHNGIIFLFTGKVTQIQSTGTKTTLIVNVADDGQPEQLICVDYWGTASFGPGQKIRIFGNRWGNKNDMPYIMAPYIYR